MRSSIWCACVGVLLLIGCNSGDGPVDPPEELAVGSITANIDDVAWRTTTALAVYSGTRLAVAGPGGGGITVGFGLSTLSPGTYTVGSNFALSGSMIDATNTVWEANSAGGTGTLTITSSEGRRVAGTFSFTMVRTSGAATPVQRTLANGAFHIQY